MVRVQGSALYMVPGSLRLYHVDLPGPPKEDRRSKKRDGPKGSEAVPTVDGGNLAPHSKVDIIFEGCIGWCGIFGGFRLQESVWIC